MSEEKLGFFKTITLGFQHVAVMYGGAITVPILVASGIGLSEEQLTYLISLDLFTCGIATILQTIGIGNIVGNRLPAMMAISFTVVQPAISIGNIYSLQGIFGAVIVSGLFVMIVAQFAGKVVKFFPNIITGGVIFIIGISLMSTAMENAAGGAGADDFGNVENLALAGFTFLLFLIINYFFKGFIKSIAVLIALAVGTIFALFFGMTSLQPVADSGWITAIKPFYFGVPEFHLPAIITMSIVATIIMVESTGVFYGLGEASNRKITGHDVKTGLRAEGLATFISGFFNAFNHSTFSQNVGLVFLTKVTSRIVVAAGGVILIILGLVPKIAAIATMIPDPVLGGAMIPMFGMLIAASIQMMSKDDLSSPNNQLVIGAGLVLGLAVQSTPGAFEQLPDQAELLLSSGPVMGFAMSFILNLILNGPAKDGDAFEEEEQSA